MSRGESQIRGLRLPDGDYLPASMCYSYSIFHKRHCTSQWRMHKIAGEIRNCEESRRQIMDKSFPEMKKYFGFGCMRLPVKGGSLVNLPEDAQKIYDDLNRKNGTHNSNASYAIRFAAGFDGIRMVLSGMSTLEQMKNNISFMKDFQPLTNMTCCSGLCFRYSSIMQTLSA